MKRPLELLKHIRDECRYLVSTRAGLDYEAFMKDETLKRSFVRSLEIIGEASRNIPEESGESTPRSSGNPWPE